MVSTCTSFHGAKPTNMLDLGSDHRAVQVCPQAPALSGRGSRRKRRLTHKDIDWEMYATKVPQKITAQEFPPAFLGDVERIALLAAGESQRPRLPAQQSNGSSHLDRLRRRRRCMTNPAERRDISKEIWRLSRKESRARQTARTTEVIASFSDLRRLDALRRFPIARSSQQGPDFRKCADLLSEIYTFSVPPDAGEHGEDQVPAVTVEEIVKAVKAMRRRRAADTKGVLLEMFIFGGDDMLHYLSDMFNAILQSGCVPADWRETFLKLLHGGGGAADPNNWRPIAILSVFYKILARVVFHGMRGVLDWQQSEGQSGFQRDRSTAGALIVAESLASKSLEFNEDLWLVSVDLRKAFDRVEQPALFRALQAQGSVEGAVDMLDMLTQTLRNYGLGLNVNKKKMLSTTVTENDTVLIETADGLMELVAASRTHKYLGRAWPGNPDNADRHVNVKLRLELINATVTPSLVYGLETCALDQKQLDHLDITQRKMLRRIVGRVFDDCDSWEDAGRRMKQRLESARRLRYIADWSSIVSKRKKHLLSRASQCLRRVVLASPMHVL
ncbi:unnamed protein product [Prorocentrum cordatum]|uniref:Reverse transcriptase domain-containing protein n=1 Tax=Prorocentrum cordatum TaxID=2364126 RepID=A0ABN9Y3F2_9DINO|nr:unnamed protein product [Polarella glacialis]